MKKFLTVILLSATITSCDYINFPDDMGPGNPPPSNNDSVVKRKVLFEEYTGHVCTFCPSGSIVANNIVNTYSGQVILVSVHAGYLAKPNSSGNFTADFRTSAGEAYNTYFAIPFNPAGLINRKVFSPTNAAPNCIGKDDWNIQASIEVTKPANAKIDITNIYVNATREIKSDIACTFIHDTLTGGPYRLVVMLLQDSIIANQKDGNIIIPNYVHRHVLRDNINGTWGEVISTVPVTKNSPITKSYTYTLKTSYPSGTGGIHDTNCDPKHCYIVAFLYNDATKEVIQVEEKEVTH